MDVVVLNGLVMVEGGSPNIFVVGATVAPNVNGVVEAAGAVGNGWLNKLPDVLDMVELVEPNGFAVVVIVLLLPTIFVVVDAVENGAKQIRKYIYVESLFEQKKIVDLSYCFYQMLMKNSLN